MSGSSSWLFLLALVGAGLGAGALSAEEPPIILDEEDVQALVQQLGAQSYQDREKASQALIKVGPAAIPELLEAREHKDPEVQSRSAEILREISVELVNQLETEDAPSAYQALQKLGSVVLPRLAEFDRLTSPKAHYLVAKLFAGIDSPETNAYLVRMAKTAQDPAREYAVRALGRRRALKHLLQLVEDGGTEDIQEMAADAIIEVGDAGIVPDLWLRLENAELKNRGLALRIIASLAPDTPASKFEPYLNEEAEMISVVAEAATALGEIGTPEAAALLFEKVLKSMNPLTCAEAAKALVRLKHPGLVDFLAGQLREEDSKNRRAALTSIAAARLSEAAPHVVERLGDPDLNVRLGAVTALGEFRSAEAIPHLVPLIADANPEIRGEALMALRRIGGDSPAPVLAATPGVHRMIKQQDFLPYCKQIVQAYLEQKSEEALAEAAVDLIYKNELLAHGNPEFRHRAAIALYRMGQKVAEPKIVEALEDRDPFVRLAAAEMLGPIGKEEFIPALIEALDDEAMIVQRAAAHSLGTLGAVEAGPRLLEILLDETAWPQVRQIAALSLATIEYEPAIPHFKKLATHADPDLRLGAASAMASLGDKACVPAFISLLRDGQPHHQQAAFLSLRQFTGQTFEFSPSARKAAREDAIRKWEEWWKANGPRRE